MTRHVKSLRRTLKHQSEARKGGHSRTPLSLYHSTHPPTSIHSTCLSVSLSHHPPKPTKPPLVREATSAFPNLSSISPLRTHSSHPLSLLSSSPRCISPLLSALLNPATKTEQPRTRCMAGQVAAVGLLLFVCLSGHLFNARERHSRNCSINRSIHQPSLR